MLESAVTQDRNAGSPLDTLQVPAGILHEVYADAQRDSGATLGFALGLARGLLTPARPALLFMQLVHEARDTGLPYGPGLASFGIDPAQLVVVRLEALTELLWAVEEAVACRAVAAVIADIGGHPKLLDFTVSRRLSLRAAGAGASVFMLRYGTDREASAARLRWRVMAAASRPPPFDEEAPGAARWQVILEKGRLGEAPGEAGAELCFDWTENGFAAVQGGEGGDGRRVDARPAPYGAQPATLGDRLSEAS